MALWSEVLSGIPPSFSYSMTNNFLALLTSQVDLPTTATLFLKTTTSTIPGIALAAAESTDFILVPKALGRCIIAYSMPSL